MLKEGVMVGIERGLIIRREHLELILEGKKIWEMRSTRTKVRGPIGLIEAGSGLVVGRAVLRDCLDAVRPIEAICTSNLHQVKDLSLLETWRFPWVLGEVERITPVPYTHPRGAVIWVRLDGLQNDGRQND